MTKRVVGLLVWLVSTTTESAVHWGVTSWLDSARQRELAASEASVVVAAVEREPARREPEVAAASAPSPSPYWSHEEAGPFGIFVLSQEYPWKLASTEVMGLDGKTLKEEEVKEKIGDLLWRQGVRYGDLIAVGTASCEGADARERHRAERRARQLVVWLRETLEGDPRQIYQLNLGRYRECQGSSDENTEAQRRVILMAITRGSHLAFENLAGELERALGDRSRLGFDLREYSLFDLQRAR